MGTKVGRRVLHKLTDRQVRTLTLPGHYGDGGGLWLQISGSGAKSWVFRYTRGGRAREMGLGSLLGRSLEQARVAARAAREMLAEGVDPIERKRESSRADHAAQSLRVTFRAEAEALIEQKRPAWKNAKHADQWTNTLETYAYPVLGDMLVSDIDTAHVERCLRPIWESKTETATRVRSRIEQVLARASVLKHRSGENPARWKGHLDKLLAKPDKLAKVRHHPALPYVEIGAFMERLRGMDSTSARLVEFIVLTACRTSEATGATWSEIDLEAGIWSVPASRMKAGKLHRVPLSPPAIQLLRKMLERRKDEFVFPSGKEGKPLSNMAGLALLGTMGRRDITIHGMRSTFRDWAAEQTACPREVVELALAHGIEDKVEAAYRRGDAFAKRKKLMADWAKYCATPSKQVATVTPIGAARAK